MNSHSSLGSESPYNPVWDRLTAVGIVTVVGGFLLWHLHDRSWFAPDEGIYASIASRLINGENLAGDIQDIHPGYGHYINALALYMFGESLVSMRYMVNALAGLVAAYIAFHLSPGRPIFAGCVAVATLAVGILVFQNPSANWYALFIAIPAAVWVAKAERISPSRLMFFGFLIGACFFTRQLSGALLGIACAAALLIAQNSKSKSSFNDGFHDSKSYINVPLLFVIVTVSLYFLLIQQGLLAFLLFGLGPIIFSIKNLSNSIEPVKSQMFILLWLIAGFLLSASPLVTIHLMNQSFGTWISDITVTSSKITDLAFVKTASYEVFIVESLALFVEGLSSASGAKILTGLFCFSLIFMSAALTVRLLLPSARQLTSYQVRLAFIALIYSMASTHFPSIYYLAFTAPLLLTAHAALQAKAAKNSLTFTAASLILVVSISLTYFIQVHERSSIDWLVGEKQALEYLGLPVNAGLWVPERDQKKYTKIFEYIQENTEESENIFVFPANPELYFMSSRSNPFRFSNSALGIQSCSELIETAQKLAANSNIKLIIHGSHHKYHTIYSYGLLDWVEENYGSSTDIAGFRVYRRSNELLNNLPACPEMD